MKKFLRNLLYVLLPVMAINLLCWIVLVVLAKRDDLTYVNYASAFDKEKRLEDLSGKKRLVIIGGSNARFGFHSRLLKDSLHLEPVNMGIHIGLGLNYMFDEVAPSLKTGDILLVSAEYPLLMDIEAFSGDEGLTDMYLIKHEWTKALFHIVETHNFLSMYRLIRRRIKRIDMKPEDIPSTMDVRTKYNEYGDYIGHYDLPLRKWKPHMLPLRVDEEVLTELHNKVKMIQDKGVVVLFIPPPYCHSFYEKDSTIIHGLAEQLKEAGIPYPFSSRECSYPDSLFYDSQYHLTRQGGFLHSRKITILLKDYIMQQSSQQGTFRIKE